MPLLRSYLPAADEGAFLNHWRGSDAGPLGRRDRGSDSGVWCAEVANSRNANGRVGARLRVWRRTFGGSSPERGLFVSRTAPAKQAELRRRLPGTKKTLGRMTLSLVHAQSSMSHARQPFSRGAVVTGVKVKRSAVKYPPELNRSVDTRRVKWEIVKPWIAARVTELLTVEDDVLIAMIYNLLEQDQVHKNGLYVYSQLHTFLEKHTDVFMRELWDMLVSANGNPSGIPQKFIDEKAAELRRQKAVADELRRRQRESDDAARRQRVKSETRPDVKPDVKPERGEVRDQGEGRLPRQDRDDRFRRRRDDSWERRYRSRSRSRSPRPQSRNRRDWDDRPTRGRSRDGDRARGVGNSDRRRERS